MKKQTQHRERRAIIIALIFLLLGILAVWLAKQFLDIEGDAIFVTILLVPTLVYLIVSGRLTELKTPGGLEAKFAGIADQSVEPISETIESSVRDMEIMVKGGVRELQKQTRRLDESRPIILRFYLHLVVSSSSFLPFIFTPIHARIETIRKLTKAKMLTSIRDTPIPKNTHSQTFGISVISVSNTCHPPYEGEYLKKDEKMNSVNDRKAIQN